MRDNGAASLEVVDLLEKALQLLDAMGNSLAAAQIDHVIHLVQENSDSSVGS
jgi:hypothetical protein